jgi:hypothetical protein
MRAPRATAGTPKLTGEYSDAGQGAEARCGQAPATEDLPRTPARRLRHPVTAAGQFEPGLTEVNACGATAIA